MFVFQKIIVTVALHTTQQHETRRITSGTHEYEYKNPEASITERRNTENQRTNQQVHRHTEEQAGAILRQTDRQTERDRGRKIETETGRERESMHTQSQRWR